MDALLPNGSHPARPKRSPVNAKSSLLRGTCSFPETKFHCSCFPNRVCDHVSCHCRHPRVGFKCRCCGEPSLRQSTDVGDDERCACYDFENDRAFDKFKPRLSVYLYLLCVSDAVLRME